MEYKFTLYVILWLGTETSICEVSLIADVCARLVSKEIITMVMPDFHNTHSCPFEHESANNQSICGPFWSEQK